MFSQEGIGIKGVQTLHDVASGGKEAKISSVISDFLYSMCYAFKNDRTKKCRLSFLIK